MLALPIGRTAETLERARGPASARRVPERRVVGFRGLRELAEWLGLDHDLAVLEAVLEGPLGRQLMRDEARRLRQIVSARRGLLQRRASMACEIVYGGDDAAFVKEIHRSGKRLGGAQGM